MQISDCYKIGYILKAHGLKGAVTISIDADAPDFSSLQSVFVEQTNRLIPFFIETISVNGDKAFVKFEDVDTPEGASRISKSAVYLPKSERPKSGRGNFYDDEIIGFEIHESELGFIGKVEAVTQAGPNKLIALNHNDKEILIPVNSPFITSINKSKKKISVTLPEGYLDI